MDITNKVVIMVTGTDIEPFDKNYKECQRTWIPELRKLGFRVIVAVGNPKYNPGGISKTPQDFKDYYKFLDDNTIQFNTFDGPGGVYDKSIYLPIKWVLEKTDYKYYFRIDSDSFVHPHRFKKLLEENLSSFPDVDYMGCCHPWLNWNTHERYRTFICREAHFAAGAGYMVSHRAMKVAYEKMRVMQPPEFGADDWVLGRAMWENGIPLLHDSAIFFESKYKTLIKDYKGIGVPDITDENSHLAIQHYMNGHMEEAMELVMKHKI
jgi:hypothetical protein